jgi:hypothetical protein
MQVTGTTPDGDNGNKLSKVTNNWVAAGDWEVEVAGKRYPAVASVAPMYDPRNQRILV